VFVHSSSVATHADHNNIGVLKFGFIFRFSDVVGPYHSRSMRRTPLFIVHFADAADVGYRYWGSAVGTTDAMNRCPVMNSQYDVERRSRCPAAAMMHNPSPETDDLHVCERIVVMFIQLKNYLGSYWLVPWFFVYIYPSILVYEWV